ncbi:MAG: AMP-binding protein, partial [Chloroflexi bacterium]|nr:AMP-binding protein [Chloroflexota bacterium]
MRKKDLGIWNSYSILGENDLHWYLSELAVQCVGGSIAGGFVDHMQEEIRYLIDDSDSIFVIAGDQEQVDKLIFPYKDREGNPCASIVDQLPSIKKVIYWDEKGLWEYKSPILMNYADVVSLGLEYYQSHPDVFQDFVKHGAGSDIAAICYTSGTTGLPKGVIYTHTYLITMAQSFEYIRDIYLNEEYLSYITPANSAEQSQVANWLLHVGVVNFPESPNTFMNDLREIGACSLTFLPIQWEGMMSMMQIGINDASFLCRLFYKLAMPVGYKVGDMLNRKEKISVFWETLYLLCNVVCFRPIRDHLGLVNVTIAATSGALLSPEVLRWYIALNVNLAQFYGQAEAMPVTMPLKGFEKIPETVGPIFPGTQVRISDNMEVLLKIPNSFQGYYKKPEKTAAKLVNGWIASGDSGSIDENTGQLVIYDRLEYMLNLMDGTKYSPSYIRNAVKFCPYIKECVVIGGEDREYIMAILTIDFEALGRWAEKRRILFTTMSDLSQRDEIYELIEPEIRRVNKV